MPTIFQRDALTGVLYPFKRDGTIMNAKEIEKHPLTEYYKTKVQQEWDNKQFEIAREVMAGRITSERAREILGDPPYPMDSESESNGESES